MHDSSPSPDLSVARLAADGLSNRQVARKLVLSIRIIELYLGNAYRKLVLRSRTTSPRPCTSTDDSAAREHRSSLEQTGGSTGDSMAENRCSTMPLFRKGDPDACRHQRSSNQ
ncbi:helix-turn-helix domain-containing protein [Frankia sp. Cr1]|uniref:helix-turn-helix domain-containing protein n=1 Tax=Frankia sp. Cr1 TaxID=3073931 RepID=UPI003A100C46